MPVEVNGKTYYRTAEVCRMAGISRNTLFRWLKDGKTDGVEYRDCRGWRLFTPQQVESIQRQNAEIIELRCHYKNSPKTAGRRGAA
jgi:predicted site-specific integrase-resolvase